MQSTSVAIWASVINSSVWAASNSQNGGLFSLIWLCLAVTYLVVGAMSDVGEEN